MTEPEGRFPTGILFFGITEIFIGGATLLAFISNLFLGAVFTNLASALSLAPAWVMLFIPVTSVISFCLGIGLLVSNPHARHMLLFFASMVILSKILIIAKIINLHGALESMIPDQIRNTTSLIYHSAILIYFNLPKAKKRFG